MDVISLKEVDEYEDILENSLNSSNVERFNKRLELYRIHSNDCKIRVDQTTEHIHEQQLNEISLLQNKPKEQKKKRTNKKGLTKQIELNPTLMKNQQRLCQSSQQQTPTLKNPIQCGGQKIDYLHQSIYEQQQSIQMPCVSDIYIKQEQCFSPEIEFEDLDFNGMANLMNHPVGPELLKFDENIQPQQQVSSYSVPQYSQFDHQSKYKSVYFNPNYFP
ncbi:hypothetical protein ACKWTF_001376 [Chironomus riparius]